MAIPANAIAMEDVLIGSSEQQGLISALHGKLEDNDDFIVGEILTIESQPQIERAVIQELSADLGEDLSVVEQVQQICDQVYQAISPFNTLGKLPSESKEREAIRSLIAQHKLLVREKNDFLQGLIGKFIRQAEFHRVTPIHDLKSRLDDVLLKLRAIENQLGGEQPSLILEPIIPKDLFQETPPDLRYVSVKPEPKVGKKAKIQRIQLPFESRMLAKYFFIALIFLSSVPAYYLSASWGVQKAKPVDIAPYLSLLPLVSADKWEATFRGVVEESWRSVPAAEKQQKIEEFLKVIKEQGFNVAILVYTDGMMVTMTTVNIENLPVDPKGLLK